MIFSLFASSGVFAETTILSETEEKLHLKFDLGTETSPVAEGYTKVSQMTGYTSELGYGFELVRMNDSRDQENPDDLRRDFVLASGNQFMIDVPNGEYKVFITTGSQWDNNRTSYALQAGDVKGGERTGGGEFIVYEDVALVEDEQITIDFSGEWARINAIEIIQITEEEELDLPEETLHLMFDFGSASSPVEDGYLQVTNTMQYTDERGYGINKNVDQRDRGAPDPLRRDFIINNDYEFMVDLPNGDYFIRIIAGDEIAFNRSSFVIEGENQGNITSNAGEYGILTAMTTVEDGQLNIEIGENGRINGLEIIPMSAITSLEVVDKVLSPEPAVTLRWDEDSSAQTYNVYRKLVGESDFTRIDEAEEGIYIDRTAQIGYAYNYAVTLVTELGIESDYSNEVTVRMVDEGVTIPNAPTGLSIEEALLDEVTISWDEVDEATQYYIYRSRFDQSKYPNYEIEYTKVGESSETSYTDDSIFTYNHYYYVVRAVNAGGISDRSEPIESPITEQRLRQMERLNRSLVAVKTEEGVYIGWRMLGTDPPHVHFDVYRDGVKINSEPITSSTNYVDTDGNIDSTYQVRVNNGSGDPLTEIVDVWSEQYLSIPLEKPEDGVTPSGEEYTYTANDASVGDLNGDGNYEIILKWEPTNAQDNSRSGYTGNVYLDAYTLEGERLWRIDAGHNIRAGAHYTQFLVYDFDGNGKSELVFKTADGTVDGVGNVIGDSEADWRNSNGYILSGPEYLTVFNGETGEALETIDYYPPRGNVCSWGDCYGNRVDRFLATVAYLDGERPSIVMARGYYTRSVLAAYDWRDGQLTERWIFDSNDPGHGAYAGQGNHSISAIDVDGDGFDEIYYGGMVVDHDGTGSIRLDGDMGMRTM